MQDTYLRAFSHFDQFQPGTNCRAWLFAILRNAFLNRVARDGREALELDEGRLERVEAESSGFPGSTIANPEDEFFRHVVDKDVAEALDRLPVLFREAVLTGVTWSDRGTPERVLQSLRRTGISPPGLTTLATG